MSVFVDDEKFGKTTPRVQEAILTLTYTSMVLSIAATISALALTDEIGEIPSRVSREPQVTAKRLKGEEWDVLRYFQARKTARLVFYHCEPMVAHFRFLITTTLYRVGMLAIGWYMRRCICYFVCLCPRDQDWHNHLLHCWHRDIPSPGFFPRKMVNLRTRENHV